MGLTTFRLIADTKNPGTQTGSFGFEQSNIHFVSASVIYLFT